MSKKFELFLGFYPVWIVIIGTTFALLLPMVQSCRHMVREDAGQAPPLNVERRDMP